MACYRLRSRLAAPVETVFAWHARREAILRLTPPWEPLEIVEAQGVARGDRTILRRRRGPLWARWEVVYGDVAPPHEFRDLQLYGPFARWEHIHRFEPDGESASFLEDEVQYRLRGGRAAEALVGAAVARHLAQTFAWRHAVTQADLASLHAADLPPQRILITGAHGLLGTALRPFLRCAGHTVQALTRHPTRRSDIGWDPAAGQLDPGALEGFDAVIHLAGENIADRRWTAARKDRIASSRTDGTRLLATTLARLAAPPRVLLSASASGFYGHRPGASLTETSPPGEGFLPSVCAAWEAATAPAAEAGIRVVTPRFGMVLTPAGGALAALLPLFRAGLGGPLGNGRQAVSWIAIDDVLGGLYHLLADPTLDGPVNFAAPAAVTNAEFGRTLGAVLHRPAIAPAPAALLRLALGEMAPALLLADARLEPARLTTSGYPFRFPDLEPALRHLLGRRSLA